MGGRDFTRKKGGGEGMGSFKISRGIVISVSGFMGCYLLIGNLFDRTK